MLDSRLGKILIICYSLFVILTPLAVLICGFESCGHYMVLPTLPWTYLVVEQFGLNFSWAVYPAFLLLNICVVYALGVLLEWLYRAYKEHRVY